MAALTFLSLELITEAASNSMLAFFFCNLIIVTILVASKPPPSDGAVRHVSVVGAPCVAIYQQEEEKVVAGHALPPNDENRASPSSETNVSVVITTHQEVEEVETVGKETGNGVYNGDRDEVEEEEEEEEEDDELRRRFEEFIEKTNQEWRAELLRTSRQL